MIKELAILLLGAAVLWGCDNTNARVEEYCGVYEGTLPAADAPGIKQQSVWTAIIILR